MENLKALKYTCLKSHYVFLFYFILFYFFFAVNVVMNRKILIKQDKSIKILKNLGLITNIEEYQKM